MKIGLLTYHHTTNFGSLLQTYGLYKAILELGYDCEVIDYHNDVIEKRETPIRIRSCRTPRDFVHYFIREPAKRKKEKNFRKFEKKFLALSEEKYDKSNIFQCGSRYDRYVVGSDLVWDFSINGHDTTYMLDFVDEGYKKIAYASSTGSVWTEKDEVINLLNDFAYIGVREQVIRDTLNQWLEKEVDFVCDPTMLLTAEQWKRIASGRKIPEKYVLCYFEDKERQIYKDAAQYGKEKDIPVYVIAYHKIPKGMKAIHPTSIEEFLSLILYADTVFTASYHGMLFSIYFERNFYYYNRGWATRMESISEYLGLQDREHVNKENKNAEIDYARIREKLEAFRNKSNEKLKKYLLSCRLVDEGRKGESTCNGKA